MANMLDQKINENEELYSSTTKELEERIGVANGEYNALLKDFNTQIGYIQNNSMLSKEGKVAKADEIRDNFINKVKVKSLDHYGKLQNVLDMAIKKDELRKLENYKGLNTDMLPQLMYVNSMINSISSVSDADLLEDVLNYASEEGNYSDELINLIYIKARNLINNSVQVEKVENDNDNVLKAVAAGKNRSKINSMIEKINKYKSNYTNEFKKFKQSFASAVNQGKYPGNLYMQRDPRRDFAVTGSLSNDPWNNTKVNSDPWNR